MFKPAERKRAKLRLGLCGPSGSGKTYSALLLASGIGGKIAVIDTENHSAELYADLCTYDVSIITAPYTVEKYLMALKEAEKLGYTVVILDSISHAWAGEGGLLDQQGKIADSSTSKNSYAAWRTVTPKHNAFIEAMLSSPCHIIATMRVKQDYVQEKNDNGKTIIRKVGLAPVQREGMEYEFTTVLDIDGNHNARASKDRTRVFGDQIEQVTVDTGKRLIAWLETGKEPEAEPKAVQPSSSSANPPPAGASAPGPMPYAEVAKKLGNIKTDVVIGLISKAEEAYKNAAIYVNKNGKIYAKEQLTALIQALGEIGMMIDDAKAKKEQEEKDLPFIAEAPAPEGAL